MGERGETQLDDLFGAVTDLTLNTQTHERDSLQSDRKQLESRDDDCKLRPHLDLWGQRRQVEGEH